jgi:hypothetical protein
MTGHQIEIMGVIWPRILVIQGYVRRAGLQQANANIKSSSVSKHQNPLVGEANTAPPQDLAVPIHRPLGIIRFQARLDDHRPEQQPPRHRLG